MKKNFLWILLSLTSVLYAQNDMHANVNLQYKFVNPGARARAMGGAFVGLADDTTAILANPAGLVQLSRKTFVAELGSSDQENLIPFFGGSIDQTGVQDFEFNLESQRFPEEAQTIPFLAYVGAWNQLKWGVFFAEQANFERRFHTDGVSVPSFDGGRFVVENLLAFFPPSENFIEFHLKTIGVSLARKISERLSFGVTLNVNDFRYRGNTTLIFPDFEALFPNENFPQSQLDALRPFVGLPFGVIDVEGDDQKMSGFVGVLFQMTKRFSLGASYKQQAKFDYDFVTQETGANFELQEVERGVASFDVPDSFSVGFSFKPVDVFLLSLEVNRLFYSELVEELKTFFDTTNDPSQAGLVLDDTTDYRLGAEYFFTSFRYPLALRAGYWSEPYHGLQNSTLDTQILFRFLDENGDFSQGNRQNVFLQRFAEDVNHITFGLGLSFGRHWTADLAGNFSRHEDYFSFSSIYRF